MKIEYIKAFSDNYIWLIKQAGRCYVVDPGDAEPVKSYLQKHNLHLAGVLITHWHPDHTGGVKTLLKSYPNINVYGPHSKKIKTINKNLSESDRITMFEQEFLIWEVPGHTLDHIVYIQANQQLAFVGDLIFSGGCGKVFEGSFKQMFNSIQRFLALPETCNIYCAHEYTLSNLKFALEVDADNVFLQERYKQVTALREKNLASVPTSLDIEKKINPFLRTASLKKTYNKYADLSELDLFIYLRQLKDSQGIHMRSLKLLIAIQHFIYKFKRLM